MGGGGGGVLSTVSGTDLRMTGQPDDVPAIARGVVPEVEQQGYRAYPLVDHIADKVAATYERYGEMQTPSTRFRDLVDLVAIVSGGQVDADGQTEALRSEFDRRNVVLPESFDVPDRALWEHGYATEARRSLLGNARTLDGALAVVRPFLDPLLRGEEPSERRRNRGAGRRGPATRTRPRRRGPGGLRRVRRNQASRGRGHRKVRTKMAISRRPRPGRPAGRRR